MQIKLRYTKATKSYHVYKAELPFVGSLYIPLAELTGIGKPAAPKELTVEVNFADPRPAA